jgi:flagellar biosynthetic protein FliP
VASQDKEKASPSKSEVRFSVLAAAFLITELKVAFQLGFIILIPFLVIDLLVANALLVLGAQQFSHSVVSVPLKILLFFVMDGWLLVSQRLLGTYVQG